jgi:hypothetical protein
MNWVMYAIWFGCGVMCGYQLHKAWWIRQQIQMKPQEYKDILKITMKGRKNGNNKHSK